MVIFIIQQIVAHTTIKLAAGGVRCADDGYRWEFCSCKYVFFMYFFHVFATMQTGYAARLVFIKTTKATTMTDEFKNIKSGFGAFLLKKVSQHQYCTDSDTESDVDERQHEINKISDDRLKTPAHGTHRDTQREGDIGDSIDGPNQQLTDRAEGTERKLVEVEMNA